MSISTDLDMTDTPLSEMKIGEWGVLTKVDLGLISSPGDPIYHATKFIVNIHTGTQLSDLERYRVRIAPKGAKLTITQD